LRARLDVDARDDRGGEVEDLLELAGGDVEQVADAARDALEEPDMGDGRGQVDVAHALSPHLLPGDLDAAALPDAALGTDALVLAAIALPVLGGTEDALAEEAVALGLERAVVDRLRLGDLAGGPVADLLARREADTDRVEIVDVDQSESSPLSLAVFRVSNHSSVAHLSVSQSSGSASTSSSAPTGASSSSSASTAPRSSSSSSNAGRSSAAASASTSSASASVSSAAAASSSSSGPPAAARS